jgi:hypothetical protein
MASWWCLFGSIVVRFVGARAKRATHASLALAGPVSSTKMVVTYHGQSVPRKNFNSILPLGSHDAALQTTRLVVSAMCHLCLASNKPILWCLCIRASHGVRRGVSELQNDTISISGGKHLIFSLHFVCSLPYFANKLLPSAPVTCFRPFGRCDGLEGVNTVNVLLPCCFRHGLCNEMLTHNNRKIGGRKSETVRTS